MPRAFLITHRRYNTSSAATAVPDYGQRDSSPERGVSVAECCANTAEHHVQQSISVTVTTPIPQPPPPPSPTIIRTTSTIIPPEVRNVPDDLYNLTQLAEVSLFHPELHGCPECGKRYSTSSNLARHRQTHRSLADKKARRCPHCDKVYVSMPAFSMHVRTHNQGCKCPYCGKCFSRPWLLQGHIRTHTGEKPFRCNICNKAFADKSNLRAHVQTHSNTKPFVCGRCGKAFALKSYLYKHEESSCMRVHRSEGGSDSSSSSSSPGSPASSSHITEIEPVSPMPRHPLVTPSHVGGLLALTVTSRPMGIMV